MKKTLIAFSCICSLFLVSCASKNIPLEEEILQAPENTMEAQAQEEDKETLENSDLETSETDGDEAQSDEVQFIEENILLPEPEDFEEPIVITILPEEIVESDSQVEVSEEEKEEPLPEEKVEVEVIPEVAEKSESEDDSVNQVSDIDSENTKEDNSDDITDIEEIEQNSETSNTSDDEVISVGDGEEGSVISEDEEESIESEEITPSRKVTMKKMEYLDISYPGKGWIYMGITDGSKDLSYFGRKLGTENTKFTLQARNAGIKIVHFYKNDALTGQYIDDYIEVEILNQKGSNKTHMEAPEYKQPIPKKAKEKLNKEEIKADEENSPELSEKETNKASTDSNASNTSNANSEAKSNVIENSTKTSAPQESKNVESILEPEEALEADKTTSSSSEKSENKNTLTDSNTLLQEAQVLYNEKEYKLALEKINSFFENASSKRDLGLYLQGQILEAKSEVQNIKAAIEAYSTLTKNYPASKRWDDANKRIIYLKRFYLEVR